MVGGVQGLPRVVRRSLGQPDRAVGGKGQARRAPREPVTDTELAVDTLRPFLLDLFRAYGTPEPNAAVVVDHLLDSSACGLPSHGVLRVPDARGPGRRRLLDERDARRPHPPLAQSAPPRTRRFVTRRPRPGDERPERAL